MPDADIDLGDRGSGAEPDAPVSASVWRSVEPQHAAALSTTAHDPAPSSGPASADGPSLPAAPASMSAASSPTAVPAGLPKLLNPVTRTRFGASRAWSVARLTGAFAIGALGCVVLVAAAVLSVSSAYANRALPGVRVGSVDVSGLSRDQIVARLQTTYAYLGEGNVTVTTPTGAATMTYGQAGRAPDVELMADEALSVGRTGNPIGEAVSIFRTAIGGRTVPIAVRVDPTAIATRVRALANASRLQPRDAQATLFYSTFIYWPSALGSVMDEAAISSAIVDRLTLSDAPTEFHAGGAFITIDPQVGDADAAAAIAAAERMVVDVTIVLSGSGAQPSAKTQAPVKTYPITAQTIRSWIVFGFDGNGKYGPSIDSARVQAYLSALPGGTLIAPVEPKVIFDSSGAPSGVAGGKDGTGLDVAATAQALGAYLARLASGAGPEASIPAVLGPISPRITVANLSGLTIMGGGKASWTTTFFPGISNGNGANIRVPASLLNGQIVPPGGHFNFLQAVSPIDSAHGYTLGGVIVGGKSDHTGAIGGGICSASTTMFNAAAWAGLKIDERHAHFYYIDRYPIGLDATVYSNGVTTWNLRWTNDTPNPIVIRSWTTRGSRSTMTVQLWSLPLDRTVTFTPAFKANVVKAVNHTVYVTSLPPGQKNWAEYATNGFTTSRTRTVTDSTGKVIHLDTWFSHYTKVDGLLQIGVSKAPPTPAPSALIPFTLAPLLAALRRRGSTDDRA